MPKSITFPNVEPQWSERNRLAFPALVDGATIRCLVALEHLMDYAKASNTSPEELVRAFKKNRHVIEDIAKDKIEKGQFVARDEILIKTSESAMETKTSDAINRDPELAGLIREATPLLAESLEDYAKLATAEWDVTTDPGTIQLTLFHPDAGTLIPDWFTREQLRRVADLPSRFDRVYDNLLRAISHNQNETIMAGAVEP